MTVDLYGSGGPGPRLGVAPSARIRPNGGRLYILMPERPVRHNNTIDLVGVFRVLRTIRRFVIFGFDTPKGRPYKRGSQGERRRRKRPERDGAAGQKPGTEAPTSSKVSISGSCVLCIVCLERDTPAAAIISPIFGLGDVFVVASSRTWPSGREVNLVTGSTASASPRRVGSTLNLRV